ncbi:Spy/CpxP family protein refolding chaperone [Diaphorobacter sp. HDW4A]|uniref:Spy/CpxP family protein refolding chaperone n=1 Tax=Diaphorobacter sp. HDW4A TaxID=2714924 RepID=UPI0014072C6A|nr:Spy/CpxP family protein refolding chaperone [Diaphorobacter sp. HDW4A]QIL82599.1 Spy/CpxP family protein refolding chaperone [Diaphorobacter sp. HDW4A]
MARFTFSTRTFAATALAAAMFAAAAAPSFAQTAASAQAPAASAPADAKPGHRPPHERGQRMTPEQRQERMAKHAEAFKQKLKITADQEPAWNAFQASMHPKDRPDHARLDPKEMDKLTTPERIDRMRAMHAQRSAEMDRRGEAVKTFYATLKPEQQKVFDQESKRMMHRFGPGGEHGPRDGGAKGHEQRRGGHDSKHHPRHDGKSKPMPSDAAPAAPVQPQ